MKPKREENKKLNVRKRMNFYRRNVAAYANDTRHLSLIEHGAYTVLLDIIYASEKPLPKKIAHVIRLSGVKKSSEKKIIRKVLKEFFDLTPKGWTQKRFIRELEHVNAKRLVYSKNGMKGGRPATKNIPIKQQGNHKSKTGSDEESKSGIDFKTLDFKTLDSRLKTNTTSNTTSTSKTTTQINTAPAAHSVDSKTGELTLFPEDVLISMEAAAIVPADVWQHFVDHRKKLKRPLTAHTSVLVQRKLCRFRDAGEDPVAILEESMINGWQGIFSMKGKSNGSGHTQESFDDKRRRESHEAINRMRKGFDRMVPQVGRHLPDA